MKTCPTSGNPGEISALFANVDVGNFDSTKQNFQLKY
jgi:hypothetical protein